MVLIDDRDRRIVHLLRIPLCLRDDVKIYALEKETNWLFQIRKVSLLIEYVNGSTLDRLKAMTVRKLMPILVQVAGGLVHMHRRGVCHADMKPNNIIFNAHTGQAKIIDYGLAWIKGEPKGRIQGTPEYMAPETVTSNFINEKTDIFNFGATMYRLVTWRLPPSFWAPDVRTAWASQSCFFPGETLPL